MTVKAGKEVLDRLSRMLECRGRSSEDADSYLQELKDLARMVVDKREMRRLSRVFKALGDEKRLSILRVIGDQEMCVCEVMVALNMTQPTASHHLGILERVGLVRERREGRWVFYSITSPKVTFLLETAGEAFSSAI